MTRASGSVDLKLEAVVIPVSDVDRAKAFYESLGWRLDADLGNENFRIVQLTPPGSECSVQFGIGLTAASPGSAVSLLVVSDIETAHDDLVRTVPMRARSSTTPAAATTASTPTCERAAPIRERRTYASFVEFSDPDGNVWQLQEITSRLPGRVDSATFSSAGDLAQALKRAEGAHGEHEKRTGERDENWPAWYAAYMLAEQTGDELPS